MDALQCEICGGKLIAKAGGIFECDSCGMQYDKSRIQEMVQEIKGTVKVEGTVKVTGKVQVEGTANKESLLKRGQLALEDSKWNEANGYFDKVLDIEPECAGAYLGKLMVERKVSKREALKDCSMPFDASDNYQKVLRFGEKKLADELRNNTKLIKERNDNCIYEKAKQRMQSAESEAEFRRAANEFNSILLYKDAEKLASECNEKAEQIKQDHLLAAERQEREQRAASERKEREQRAAAEKTTKKKKRIAAILFPTVVVCAALVAVLLTVIIPKQKHNTLVEEYGQDLVNQADKIQIGDTYTFGSYPQNDSYGDFREEIEWTVLDKDGISLLLISNNGLDCQPYEPNSAYNSQNITWENCYLREWLNDEFLNAAFSAEEQAQILSTNVSADKNPNSDADPGNSTTDKMFLLSIPEAEKYFSSDEARLCAPTKYAKARGAQTNDSYKTGSGEYACTYWLRSPGAEEADDVRAAYIYYGGVSYLGDWMFSDENCVRPVMWIKLK